MAIRFACPACHQPIEVDDNWANQSVGCPYCKKVVTAPSESSWPAGGVHVAEPAGDQPYSESPSAPRHTQQPPDHGAGYPSPQGYASWSSQPQRKSTCAWMAFILMFLYFGLTIAGLMFFADAVQQRLGMDGTTSFQEHQRALNEMMLEEGRMPGNAASATAGVAALIAGVIGLILAIASLIRGEPRKVIAVISLLGCLTSFCCGGYLAMTNMTLPVPPQPASPADPEAEPETESEDESDPEVPPGAEASSAGSKTILFTGDTPSGRTIDPGPHLTGSVT